MFVVNVLHAYIIECVTDGSYVYVYIISVYTIYIEGKLRTRKYEDESGVKKYTTEIVLQGYNSTLKILSGKINQVTNQQDTTENKQTLPKDEAVPSNDLDDEIPF